MIEYLDKFGTKIKVDNILLQHRDDGAFLGVVKETDGLLYFCRQSYYDSEQGRQLLNQIDLSKISVLDVSKFNRQFKKTGLVQCFDINGIEIQKGMGLFIGNFNGGNGNIIEKQGNELVFGFGTESNPHFESLTKLSTLNIDFIVEFIPIEYLDELNKRNEGYMMKKFNGLVCSGCGSELDLVVSYDGLDNKAVDYDKRFSPNWGYEIELVCSKCGRAYGICRTDKDSHISEITHE